MVQQPDRQFTILETEKDVCEQTFFLLKSPDWQVFLLNTGNNVIDYYFMDDKEVVVIKSLISRSPLLVQDKLSIPSLEKILVDIFCDEKLFSAYSGQELMNIYKYVQKKYTINYSRLLNYAGRRNRRDKISELVCQNADDSLKEILNDIK